MLFPMPRSITIAIMTLACYSDHSTEKCVLPGDSKNHVFTMWENLPLNESVFENKMHCRIFEVCKNYQVVYINGEGYHYITKHFISEWIFYWSLYKFSRCNYHKRHYITFYFDINPQFLSYSIADNWATDLTLNGCYSGCSQHAKLKSPKR